MPEIGTWHTVLKKPGIAPGEIAAVTAGELEIAICNVEGVYYATSNICSHAYAYLSDGDLDGDIVECPLHGGAFEVKTGKAVCEPAEADIRSFPVRVVGDEIQIMLD